MNRRSLGQHLAWFVIVAMAAFVGAATITSPFWDHPVPASFFVGGPR